VQVESKGEEKTGIKEAESGIEEELVLKKSEVDELRKKAEESDSFLDKLLRTRAELLNYQKRMRKEHESTAQYAIQDLILDLLPEFDNFERAAKLAENSKDINKFVEGVKLIEDQLFKVLEKHGVENAKEEAEILMMMVSSSSEVNMRPHILAKGELSRTFFTFQTFFLNRWGIMAHDLITSGVIKNPDWGKKVAALIGLGIFLAGSIAEDEAREFVYEMTTRRELPDMSVLGTVLLAIPKNIPFFGNIIEAVVEGRGSTEIPLQRTVTNLLRGPYKVLTAKEKEAMIRGIIQSSEAILTLGAGVPATAQVADILEGIFAPKKKKGKRSIKKRKKK
ncbi:hypothetical protein LCGC14_1245240, partial [marine sediment metagenome]